jgi:hypothetical protein
MLALGCWPRGRAVRFTPEIPDVHHYKGNFGGRVFPLWLDAAATVPNAVPGLVEHLSRTYQHPVNAGDVFSYLAAVLAHPGYVKVFTKDLTTPGIRVPLTASLELFARAVAIGRKVLSLHTYGQRLTDPSDEGANSAPRLPPPTAPKVLAGPSTVGPQMACPTPSTTTLEPRSCMSARVGSATSRLACGATI